MNGERVAPTIALQDVPGNSTVMPTGHFRVKAEHNGVAMTTERVELGSISSRRDARGGESARAPLCSRRFY